ncbi:inactive histone-lysine N-methyltransferase 2E [Biomphalaria pfeifferi]|uniref:Inactive histone-lysine N-methyltransferase 2E n=1 Tax=Biomphalaria pfeifferi TaxID=112525 RepID=A0AAD8B995_BIOPF|nr:inactive histone-lysine N-methyltransferase 2E [Biomphalaria pfeifferi]
MLTSTPLSILSFIMESVQQLDPTLLAFWEGFPCPPPWKKELLFRLNFTSCVNAEVGERVKLYMADKCNIRRLGEDDKEAGGTAGGVMVEDECALTCQAIIGVVSIIFLVLLLVVIVLCVRRHRAKPASPSHQSSLTAHPDNAKYYTSCHYACAPVVGRQLQTSIHGDRLETSVVASTNNGNGHYQPGVYPQHTCQPVNYRLSHHQQPRLINTPYGQVPAHTSTLVIPHQLRYNNYRKLDGAYSSSSISNSDRSPVYESIGDAESVRERCTGVRGDASECEFCECGGDHGSEHSGYVRYNDPIILTGQPNVKLSLLSHQQLEDPPGPCPPMYMDGYYSDKCPQTLPLRPIRSQSKTEDEYSEIEPDEVLPLNQKNSTNQNEADEGGKSDLLRGQPSSGSCYSSNGSHYKDGNYSGQRRVIPALHPHYFINSPEEIS